MENREHPLPPQPDAQWVSLWLDGQLSPEQQQRLLQALEQDAQLAQLARQWEQLRQQLRALPREELGEEFTQGVMQRIEAVAGPAEEPAGEADSASPKPAATRPAGPKPARRWPWEFWACVGTGVLAASLLLVWAFWEPEGPGRALVMQEDAPGANSVLVEKDRLVRERIPEDLEDLGELTIPGILEDERFLIPLKKESKKESLERKSSKGAAPPAKASDQSISVGKRGLPTQDALPRAAGPRPKAPLAGGAVGGVHRAQRLRARHAPPTQVIPWNRLPKPLQSTLVQSQQATAASPPRVIVLQLGVRADALRQGWLGSQLAAVQRDFSQDKARRALGPPAPPPQGAAAALSPSAQKNDRKNRGQEKAPPRLRPRDHAPQVVRVQVSPEQLPRLLDRLARSQAPRGPVQYLNQGYLVSDEALLRDRPKEFQGPGRTSAPGAAAVQGAVQFGKRELQKQRFASQQLILQTVPQASAAAAEVRQQTPEEATASQPAENSNAAKPKPQTKQAASPVVDLWLVVEVQTAPPPRGKLPLVAPPPKRTP